jgi:hypothetical protein
MAPLYSPHANVDALDWYGELAASAKDALFMRFSFGMNDIFRQIFGRDDSVLRFDLMEERKRQDAQIAAIRKLQARSNVTIATGNRMPPNKVDQWLKELDRITSHAMDPSEIHVGRSLVRQPHCRDRVS